MKSYDACVIGAGPAGITAAIECADKGLSVVLVESGTANYNDTTQHLSDAEILSQKSHSVMNEAVYRGLGGTSVLWGGRCVPLDDIDFEARNCIPASGWPFDATELSSYYPKACELLGIGNSNFDINSCNAVSTKNRPLSAQFIDPKTINATRLERWCRKPNLWEMHRDKIMKHKNITLMSGMTCIEIRQSRINSAISDILLQPTLANHLTPSALKAHIYIIACGGVESTRLILNAMRAPLRLKLHSPNLVGRYYMGHPSGKIADVKLFGPPEQTLYGFEREGNVYIRRRMTISSEILRQEKLLNIAFWLDNPALSDWRHGSGILSAAYLAITAPVLGKLLAPAAIRKRICNENAELRIHHLKNCIRSPISTSWFCLHFAWQRYFSSQRLPGFFTYSRNNQYALHYHAEQSPNWNSSITLSDQTDAHGLYRAKISLKWSSQDIDSIIRAHKILDRAMQSNGIGRLLYRIPEDDFEHSIREQAIDGFHQIGTLRMSSTPSEGVTDSFGRVYGIPNLFIASSATFPTSGQANPTLALVALTVRQAKKIATEFRRRENHA